MEAKPNPTTAPVFPVVGEDEYFSVSDQGLQDILKRYDPKMPRRHVLWTNDYTVELPIRMKRQGPGSERPVTIIDIFQECVNKFPNTLALHIKRDKHVHRWTYKEFFEDAALFGKALLSLGIRRYKAVNIIGFNAPEWFIAFHGSILAGSLPVGVYTTNGPDACKYVAEHSEAELVVAENTEHLKKYLKIWDELPLLKYVVLYAENVPADLPAAYKSRVMTFKDFLAIGRTFVAKDYSNSLEGRMAAQKPGNCCTIVYTSGTTGMPKGVMLSHDNYTWTAMISNSLLKEHINPGNERLVSYLPLSHVAAQMMDIIQPLLAGVSVYVADPGALQGTLINTLLEVRPTIVLSVPRVWEKIEEKIKGLAAEAGTLRQKLSAYAKSVGTVATEAEILNQSTPWSFPILKSLIFNTLKKRLGMDEAKILMYGAAPLSRQTREYFFSLNMFLVNAYGMSESSGPQTMHLPNMIKNKVRLDSAGFSLPGTDLFIYMPDKDQVGEICFRGRNRFMGYYKNDEETIKCIDEKGYIHSGDLGRVDADGNLLITGRIKELIVTAGGENVAPILIETEIVANLPLISNIMIVGDNRKYLSALITLKTNPDKDGQPSNQLTEEVKKVLKLGGNNGTTVADAINDPTLKKLISEAIDKANSKAISRAHSVRKWVILENDFSVNGGELTATLKLKRNFVEKKYAALIEKLYIDAKL